MSGLSEGRPFAAKILPTAAAFSAVPPSPYKVSVGNATSSPARISAAARLISEASIRQILFSVFSIAGGLAGVFENQECMREPVQIAIQHAVHVADRKLGSMILDHPVGSQYIAADLTPKIDVKLRVFQLLISRALLLHLKLVQAGPHLF